jgi:hypothetical protein
MTEFFQKLPYDLVTHAGMAFVGKYLTRLNVNSLIDPKLPVLSSQINLSAT